jgi:uncharacterized repeat protein (TIGR01451 family)
VALGVMRDCGRRLAVWVALASVASGSAWGGGFVWTSGGPDGGPVEALVFDPAASSTLYAASRHNAVFRSVDAAASWAVAGAGLPPAVRSLAITADGTLFAIGEEPGVFRSIDDGASWQLVLDEPATAVAAEPTATGTVYAGTTQGSVHRTTNAGASWTSSSQGLAQDPITRLAVDPLTPSTLYLGLGSAGVYKSTDGGVSWTDKNQGIVGATALSLVIDPQAPSTLYIASNLGLFKSTDGAESWNEAGDPLGVFVSRLAIDPNVPSTLLAGAFGRILVSSNGGVAWSDVSLGVPPAEVLALAVDPSSTTTFYAGTEAGFIKSLDSGASWTAANLGLRSVRVERLAVDPGAPETLYAASPESGIFRSVDAGASWAAVGSGLGELAIADLALASSLPQTLYAAQARGLRRSQDGGASWSNPVTDPELFGLLGPEVVSLAADPLDALTLFAANRAVGVRDDGSGPGVLRSTDGAVSWLRVLEPAGLSAVQPGQVAIDPTDPDRVLAAFGGRETGGIAEVSVIQSSLDGGSTWSERLRRAGADFIAFDFDPLAPGTVYGLVDPGPGFAALRSLDGGAGWSDLPLALPCLNDLLPDPVTAGTLWAACDPVYTSDDGGATWTMFDATGLPAGGGGVLVLARAGGASETIHAGTPVGVFSYSDLPVADLAVTKDDGVTEVGAGGALTYTIEVTNLGPADAFGAGITDDLPVELTCTWACVGAAGGICEPAPPAGDLDETVDLPLGATVTLTASCTVDGGAGGLLVNTAVAVPPVDTVDPVAGNDTATDTDVVPEPGPCGTFNDRHLSDVVLAGSETVEACVSITAGPGVEVTSEVLFRAPLIAITELSVTSGSFTAVNEAPTP